MAYPTDLLTDDEEVIADFHPHWRVLLTPILTTIVVAVAAAALLWLADRQEWGGNPGLWIPLVAVVVIVALAAGPVVRWWTTQYVLTSERIIERSGILSRSGVEIPLENINNVLYNQSAPERLLRYGDVVVESAGSQGQTRLADIPDPQQFQSQIYRARETRTLALEGGGRPRDVAAQLESLAALHDAGKLTDEEFARQKRRLMDD